MDEKLMVREQDRLAREKKKKKYRKRKIVVASVIGCLAIGGIWYVGWGRNLKPQVETTVQIAKEAGQEIVYGDLTAVKGNEITYLVAKEQEADKESSSDEEQTTDKGQKPGKGERPGRGQMPGGGEMPDMSQMPGGGEMPDMSQMPGGGEMPDFSQMSGDGEMPDMGQMFDGMGGSRFSGEESQSTTFTYNNVVYEVSDESVTTMIPVGTDVITKLGNVTTFSRLAAGDKVALVMEEDVIVAVYIIG